MKTLALYYDYSLNELPAHCTAHVIETHSCNDKWGIILDKTIFYPEGGGQPADRGTINGIPVIDVRNEDGKIVHTIENSDQAITGEVELELDLVRRRDITVQHSAQHLLSGIILRMTGFPTVSMHLGEEYTTIDLKGPSLHPETILQIEDAAMAAIEEDHPYVTHLCPPEHIEDLPLRRSPPQNEEQIRVVEIGGVNTTYKDEKSSLDFSPCCGTHVSSTGQIGMIRILAAEKYKGMTRMTFIAGRRCLDESRMLRKNAVQISRVLSVPVEETGKAVTALTEKTAALEEQLKAYREEAAHREAEAMLARALSAAGSEREIRFYAESFSGKEMEEILSIGKQIQKSTGAIIVLGSEKDLKFAALCSAKGADLRPQCKKAMEAAGGKGGGGPSFFQGQFDSIEKYRFFFSEVNKMDSI